MMWVETLSRYHDVIARFRCDGASATIGRAYDNDVVLDDPYVAAHHLRITTDESGKLVAEDLGTANGIEVEGGGERQTHVPLEGDRILRIGRTLLRVRTPDYAVPDERHAVASLRSGPFNVGLSLAVIGFALLALWLGETDAVELSHYVLPILGMILIVLVWTTAWSVLSRIFAGHAQFDRHLMIALGGLLVLFVTDELTDYAAFAFSAGWIAEYAYVPAWLLLGAMCVLHLREVSPRHPMRKFAIVGGVLIAAIAAQTVVKTDDVIKSGQQAYLSSLKPPAFRLRRPLDESAFLAETERIKDAVDKSRRDPPGAKGLFEGDEE